MRGTEYAGKLQSIQRGMCTYCSSLKYTYKKKWSNGNSVEIINTL